MIHVLVEAERNIRSAVSWANMPKAEDLFWHRQHTTRNELIRKILSYTAHIYGQVAINEVWDEFHGWSGDPFDPESSAFQIFMPWFFYNRAL